MVRCLRVRQNIISLNSDALGKVGEPDRAYHLNGVTWGSWGDGSAPHVCGVCKPVLDEYLVPVSVVDVAEKWPDAICLTCGWVPMSDPERKRLVKLGHIFHSHSLARARA